MTAIALAPAGFCQNGCGQQPHKRPIDCPIPPALITTADGIGRDGLPYVIRYDRNWWAREKRDPASGLNAGLDQRTIDAVRSESPIDPRVFDFDSPERRGLFITGRARAATEPAGLLAWDGQHHYPHNRQRVRVVDDRLADGFLTDKRERWTEIADVADGYIKYRADSRFAPLLDELADRQGLTWDQWGRRTGLVFLVHADREAILHIGSFTQRVTDNGTPGGVTLAG